MLSWQEMNDMGTGAEKVRFTLQLQGYIVSFSSLRKDHSYDLVRRKASKIWWPYIFGL